MVTCRTRTPIFFCEKKRCAEGPRAVAGGIEQGRSRAAVLWRRPALCVQHSGTDPPALTRIRTSVRDIQSSTGSARASCSPSLHVTARARERNGVHALVARASVSVSATHSQLTDQSIVCLRVRLSCVRTQSQHWRAFSAASQRERERDAI